MEDFFSACSGCFPVPNRLNHEMKRLWRLWKGIREVPPTFGPTTTTSHWNCGVSIHFICLGKDWIQPRPRIVPSSLFVEGSGTGHWAWKFTAVTFGVFNSRGTNLEFNYLKWFKQYSNGLSGMKLQAGLKWRDKLYPSLSKSICEFCRSGLIAHGQTVAVGPTLHMAATNRISQSFFPKQKRWPAGSQTIAALRQKQLYNIIKYTYIYKYVKFGYNFKMFVSNLWTCLSICFDHVQSWQPPTIATRAASRRQCNLVNY